MSWKDAADELRKRGLLPPETIKSKLIVSPDSEEAYIQNHKPYQPVGMADWRRTRDIKEGKLTFTNLDKERIKEIEAKFTAPRLSKYFSPYSKGEHSKVFTVFDTETDDKGHILTVAAHKVQYNYTKQQLENADVANNTYYRVYSPPNADIRATEAVHGFNIPILKAMRNKLKAKYSDTFDTQERKKLLEFFKGTTVVGHNIAEADLPWIFNKTRGWNAETGFGKPFIDTLQLARGLWKGKKNDLEAASTRMGVGFDQLGLSHHLAEADVVVTAKLFEQMVKNFSFIRNSMDFNIQTNPYNERNRVRGASGFFHKVGGALFMDEYENEDRMAEEYILGAEDMAVNGGSMGLDGEEIREALTDAKAWASERRGDAERVTSPYVDVTTNEWRFFQEAKQHFKHGASYEAVRKLMGNAYHVTGTETLNDLLARAEYASKGAETKTDDTWKKIVAAREDPWRKHIENTRLISNRLILPRKQQLQDIERSTYWSALSKPSLLKEQQDVIDYYEANKQAALKYYQDKLDNAVTDEDKKAWLNWEQDEPATWEKREWDSAAAMNRERYENPFARNLKSRMEKTEALKDALSSKDAKWLSGIDRFSLVRKQKDLTESLQDYTKAIDKAIEKNKTIVGVFNSMSHAAAGIYNPSAFYAAEMKGVGEVGSAVQGVLPRFLRPSAGHLTTAFQQSIEGRMAKTANVWNNLSNIGNIVGAGGGALIAAGFPIAGIPIAGLGIAASIGSNIAGGTQQANLTNYMSNFAGKLNLVASMLSALAIPLRAFRIGLSGITGVFSRLANLWGSQYGIPYTKLTGINNAEYGATLGVDSLMGFKPGTTNRTYQEWSNAQVDMYMSGKFDQERLIAASRLGVFDLAYAPPGGDVQEQRRQLANRLYSRYKSVNPQEAATIMRWAGLVDNTMPETLETMRQLGISDYGSLINGNWARSRGLEYNTNRNWAKYREVATLFGLGEENILMNLKDASIPLWQTFGLPTMNAFSRATSSLSSIKSPEDVGNIATQLWKDLEDIYSPIFKNIKLDISEEFSTTLVDGVKNAFSKLSAKASEIVKELTPFMTTVVDWFNSWDFSFGMENGKFKLKYTNPEERYSKLVEEASKAGLNDTTRKMAYSNSARVDEYIRSDWVPLQNNEKTDWIKINSNKVLYDDYVDISRRLSTFISRGASESEVVRYIDDLIANQYKGRIPADAIVVGKGPTTTQIEQGVNALSGIANGAFKLFVDLSPYAKRILNIEATSDDSVANNIGGVQ